MITSLWCQTQLFQAHIRLLGTYFHCWNYKRMCLTTECLRQAKSKFLLPHFIFANGSRILKIPLSQKCATTVYVRLLGYSIRMHVCALNTLVSPPNSATRFTNAKNHTMQHANSDSIWDSWASTGTNSLHDAFEKVVCLVYFTGVRCQSVTVKLSSYTLSFALCIITVSTNTSCAIN